MTKLHWITPLKANNVPVTSGIPWGKGELARTENLRLEDCGGAAYPAQIRPIAFWPDGSVKWTAISAVLPSDKAFTIKKGEGAVVSSAIVATQSKDGSITVNSDLLSCKVEKGGALFSNLLRKSQGNQKPVSAKLVAVVENISVNKNVKTLIETRLEGETREITLEEAGPIRAVVKLEGIHRCDDRELFPFIVRLYFYQNSDEVKIVHTFLFDADENNDAIKGIAVEMTLGAAGEMFNRHVAFAGERGLFYEGIQGMYSGNWRRGNVKESEFTQEQADDIYATQQRKGQFVSLDRENLPGFAANMDDNAIWRSFRFSQDSCDHYIVTKAADEGCCHITAAQGTRSNGAAFFGSSAGIMALSVKDFWQKSPMAFEIENASDDNVTVTTWLWSPFVPAMDFRVYDTVPHNYSYGSANNHPEGIANTNEITLKLFDEMPGKQAIWDFAIDKQNDALLVAGPEVYENTAVFGTYWKRQTDERYVDASLEKALLNLVYFYMDEVKQRRWYGFWNFGDVMHSYDHMRHCWRYDRGGYAWQNTELCNTYVNWLTFLRTGDYDIFKFARTMSRHCSEVDTYHFGKFAMLGTRHSVVHWQGGAKEVRISMAGHHRFFYYLTADERIGDIMDEVKDADLATFSRDPMGSYFESHDTYRHVRVGPDWTSFLINWMTRWERFEDEKYRDKLLTSLESVKSAPLGLSSGSTFHYNPHTGIMHYVGAENPAGHTHLGEGNYQQHMVICFGGPETWFELSDWLDDDEMRDQIAQFGAFYAMTPDERTEASGGRFEGENQRAWRGDHWATRMFAYAGARLQGKDKNADRYAQQAKDHLWPWKFETLPDFLTKDGEPNYEDIPAIDSHNIERDVPGLTTNAVSQWSLNYMETVNLLEQADKNKK